LSNEFSGDTGCRGHDAGPSDGHDSHRPVRSFEDVADTGRVRDILCRVGRGIWDGIRLIAAVGFLIVTYPLWRDSRYWFDDDV